MSDTRSPGHLDRCTNIINGVPCEGRYSVTSRLVRELFVTQYVSCPVCGDKPVVHKRMVPRDKILTRRRLR